MSTFTPEQRAEIFRQSREHLEHDDRPVPPAVLPEPAPIDFEDAQTKWNREAEAADAARRAYKAQARREEERAARTHARAVADAASIEDRLDALESRMDDVEQAIASLAQGSVGFSDAVTERLHAIEALVARLDNTLANLRGAHSREVEGLRSQLTASDVAHTREMGLVTKQLADTQRALDRAADRREREQLRADIETTNGNIVELHRAITERNGAA